MTEQRWDPRTYAQHARFVSDLGAGVVDLLAPRPGERILDLGCGDGALTEKLVAAGASVVAVDDTGNVVAFSSRHPMDPHDDSNDFDLFVWCRSSVAP